MKKFTLVVVGLIMMMTMVVGCSNDKTGDTLESKPEVAVTEFDVEEANDSIEGIMADILINIEGVVAEIDGNVITLDTGKVVIISDETAFETQKIGDVVEIENVIEVGNFIQGYTSDDPEANEVNADVINTNEKMQISSKIAINIEGVVVAVEENVITLDNGQKFMVTDETAFETQVESDVNSSLTKEVNEIFEIGNLVQGFTMDDFEKDIVVALVINSNGKLQ